MYGSFKHLISVGLLSLGLHLTLSAYTFTDTKGRQFEGDVIGLQDDTVTVLRHKDQVMFELNASIFVAVDQAYLKGWSAGQQSAQSQITQLESQVTDLQSQVDQSKLELTQLQAQLDQAQPNQFKNTQDAIQALSRQLRIDLIWEPGPYNYFEVQRAESATGEWETLPNPTPHFHLYSDYIGSPNITYYYRIRGLIVNPQQNVQSSGNWSRVVHASTTPFNRNTFLNELQEACVRFFIEMAHPVSGLSLEGSPGWGETYAVGSSGMGMANIVVAVHRGFISRDEGLQLALRMLRFLDEDTETVAGAFGHWMNGQTGQILDFGKYLNAADAVETSFLIQGAILLREFFDRDHPDERELRTIVTRLAAEVQWDQFMLQQRDGPIMAWHLHRIDGLGDLNIRGFHEAMMPYILGIGSDTYPIPPKSFYTGWMDPKNGLGRPRSDYNIRHSLGQGTGWPLFFAHFSHIGFDPRALSYRRETYFDHFKDAVQIQRLYAQSRANEFKGYDKLWGLSAGLTPEGYRATEPGPGDDGTIATSAALSSMPYLPDAVLECMEAMYLDYGDQLWGVFGFYNAICPSQDWVGRRYIGIELGPIAPMIENYRSGLLWKLFMQAPEVQRAQTRIDKVLRR